MGWFLYDNGLGHQRVNSVDHWIIQKKYEIDMKPLSLEKLGMFKHFYCLFI